MIIRRGTDGALIYALSICQMSQQGHWKYILTSIIVAWWYAFTLDSFSRVSGPCSWTTRTRSEPRCRSPKRLWEKLRASLSRAALEHYPGGPRAPRPRILRAHTPASGPAGVRPWLRPRPRLSLGPTLLCPDKRIIIIILLQPTRVLHNLQPATVRRLKPAQPEPASRHPCPRPRLQDPGPKSTRRSWKDHSGTFRKLLSRHMGNDRHFSPPRSPKCFKWSKLSQQRWNLDPLSTDLAFVLSVGTCNCPCFLVNWKASC